MDRGRVDRSTDGQKQGLTEGGMDRWMDGQRER
jgi:hypothetical protein